MKPPELDNLDHYRERFADPTYWQPYVAEICRRHHLAAAPVTPQLLIPGTYPTFAVERRWIVKFFGRLFDGADVFRAELESQTLVAADPEIPAPPLKAHSRLFDDPDTFPWPYMIFPFIDGDSLGTVRNRLSRDDLDAIAAKTADIASRLHALPIPSQAVTLQPTWDRYTALITGNRDACVERNQQWGSLPAHFLDQIDAFLPPEEELIPFDKPPCFLHADLTADHLLLERDETGWQLRALIDFGDAQIGDPLYELIPLHLDLFQADRRLLSLFLESYRPALKLDSTKARILLSLCLLHPFDVLIELFEHHPEAASLPTLADLADWLWRFAD